MGQLYEEIDFARNKACKYDHKCADRPGFNSFMAELRRSLGGKSWERAPSSKERRAKMYRILQRAHCGKDHIKFFKFSYIIESKEILLIPSCFMIRFPCFLLDGDLGEEVCICEHAYMVALGYNVMPKQWKELKILMLEPHGREFFNQRVQVKTDHCTVYIADFKDRNCDYSAFAGDTNIFTICTILFCCFTQIWKALKLCHFHRWLNFIQNILAKRS
jgi:hypothetical protein